VRINDVTQIGVLSMSAVPVSRAHQGTRVFAAAPGVDVVANAPFSVAEHARVERVSCRRVAKPVAGLWLKSLVEAGMVPALQQGSTGGVGLEDRGYGFGGDQAGTTGTNGSTSFTSTTLIDPRDFRTSSPPG
jgi:hypothetical protein